MPPRAARLGGRRGRSIPAPVPDLARHSALAGFLLLTWSRTLGVLLVFMPVPFGVAQIAEDAAASLADEAAHEAGGGAKPNAAVPL